MGVTGRKLGDITGVTSSQMSQAPRGGLAYGEAQGMVVPSGTKGGKDSVRGLERPSWGRWDGGRALKPLPVDVGVSGRIYQIGEQCGEIFGGRKAPVCLEVWMWLSEAGVVGVRRERWEGVENHGGS